jgi:hypothetical protein
MKLSPPWISYFNQLKALFEKDPDVKLEYDDDKHMIEIYVKGEGKAEAIVKLLPERKTFGNVNIDIIVIPSNTDLDTVKMLEMRSTGTKP